MAPEEMIFYLICFCVIIAGLSKGFLAIRARGVKRGGVSNPAPAFSHSQQLVQDNKPIAINYKPVASGLFANPDWLQATLPQVQTINLSTLAQADNVLIVGNKGSGKTTLLMTLLSVREDAERVALDPHDKPNKWGFTTVGSGRNYAAIAQAMQVIANAMDTRFQQMGRGEVDEGEFPRRTIVGDEFRSIHDEVKRMKLENVMLPGDVILSRISEGRKVGECAALVCHNDTVEALGIQGNADMKSCFDYIVYMGALITTRAKRHGCPDDVIQTAMELPRPAVTWNPERNNWYVVNYDVAPVFPPKNIPIQGENTHENRLDFSQNNEKPQNSFADFSASGSQRNDETFSLPDFAARETAKLIAMIARNEKQTVVVRSMPGYRADQHQFFVARYHELKALVDEAVVLN